MALQGFLSRLGSARSGAEHWKLQRLTAVGLVVLAAWLVVSLVRIAGEPFEVVRAWLGGTFNATMMILTLVAGFWHARLGIQVIVEDYVHNPGWRVAALVLNDLLTFAFATLGVVAVVTVAAGG